MEVVVAYYTVLSPLSSLQGLSKTTKNVREVIWTDNRACPKKQFCQHDCNNRVSVYTVLMRSETFSIYKLLNFRKRLFIWSNNFHQNIASLYTNTSQQNIASLYTNNFQQNIASLYTNTFQQNIASLYTNNFQENIDFLYTNNF